MENIKYFGSYTEAASTHNELVIQGIVERFPRWLRIVPYAAFIERRENWLRSKWEVHYTVPQGMPRDESIKQALNATKAAFLNVYAPKTKVFIEGEQSYVSVSWFA